MSDAAPEFDPFISSGPDPERPLWVVQQLEGQIGPFFDSEAGQASVAPEGPQAPHLEVPVSETIEDVRDKEHAILFDKNLAYPEKVILLTQTVFEEFGKQLDDPDKNSLPTQEELEVLYDLALYLHDHGKVPAVEIALEFLEDAVGPYRRLSPLKEAESLAKRWSFRTEAEISLLMIKAWVRDRHKVEMPTLYDEIRQKVLRESQKTVSHGRFRFLQSGDL